MLKTTKQLVAAALLAGSAFTAGAQEALRTAYFSEGYLYRHELNPAFEPERDYIGMPALANLNVGLASNVGVNSFLFKTESGKLTTFMNSSVDAASFLKDLPSQSKITTTERVTLLSAGFKGFGGYNTISIGARANAAVGLPKDLFSFAKLGMDGSARYNLKDIRVDASAIAEVSLGHSRKITDRLRMGAKLNILLGFGNAYADIKDMDITMNGNVWSVKANGYARLSAGSGLYVPTKAEAGAEIKRPGMESLVEWGDIDYSFKGVTGAGATIDLGATYDLLPDLQLSAAIHDFGFMTWRHGVVAKTSDQTWEFDGFHDISLNSDQPNHEENKIGTQFDNMWDEFQDLVSLHRTSTHKVKTNMMSMNILIGAEYKMPFYKKLKAGILWTSHLQSNFSWSEGRISATVQPVKWFDAAVSYAAGSYGHSFGWLVNFHPKGFTLFVGSDHQFFHITPQILPVGKANASVNFGISFPFGARS